MIFKLINLQKMPRRLEHPRRCNNFADVTINSYANSKVKCNKSRIKKNALMKPERTIYVDNDDISDEFDISTCGLVKTNRNANDKAIQENHQYNNFPIDVWWLISEHIAPDDVNRFALICKATYSIASSINFWKCIYKRHYSLTIRLPTRLQPDCMARPRGLRACVIRSLYYTYTPFLLQLVKHPQQDFHRMTNRYVEQFWFTRKSTNTWLYFYKLKRKPMAGSRLAESELLQRCHSSSVKALRDIYMNSEEGCSLLVIQTNKFHPLPRLAEEMQNSPNIMLTYIGHHLTRSCSHYRLELKFSSVTKQTIATTSYEPAVSVTVHDWWTPNYYKYVKQGFQDNVEFLKDEKDQPEEIDTDDDLWNFNFG